jgi:hypothetical protein
MTKNNSILQYFHIQRKCLPLRALFLYLLHMLRVFFFSLFIISVNVASANGAGSVSCEVDESLNCVSNALKCANLDPYSVSYTPTSGFPNENGEVQVNIEVRGSTYGGMVILCNMKTDKLISFISEYQEIGQN